MVKYFGCKPGCQVIESSGRFRDHVEKGNRSNVHIHSIYIYVCICIHTTIFPLWENSPSPGWRGLLARRRAKRLRLERLCQATSTAVDLLGPVLQRGKLGNPLSICISYEVDNIHNYPQGNEWFKSV